MQTKSRENQEFQFSQTKLSKNIKFLEAISKFEKFGFTNFERFFKTELVLKKHMVNHFTCKVKGWDIGFSESGKT